MRPRSLGLALEHTYGKSYEELVQIKITGPLEMNHTKVKLNAEEIASFPKGYSVSGSISPGPIHTISCSRVIKVHRRRHAQIRCLAFGRE